MLAVLLPEGRVADLAVRRLPAEVPVAPGVGTEGVARLGEPLPERGPGGIERGVANETSTAVTKANGIVHAAGWASRTGSQPPVPRPTPTKVANVAPIANVPPTISPAAVSAADLRAKAGFHLS